MAVMERERWTDERLDHLAVGIDKRFDRVEADLRELRSDVKKGFEAVDKRFEAIDKFDRKFDSLQRNMTTWFIAMFSTNITLAAAVIAAAALG